MLDCKITFNGIEFPNAKAFADYLRQQSLDPLSAMEAPLAKIIAEKYSSSGPDSVAEMMAKLEARKNGEELSVVTPADVDRLLYPSGQAQDYVTQSLIHTNTYAGVKATGITANFSKMLAYLFSATPVTELKDSSTGESYSVDTTTKEGEKNLNKLLAASGANSINALIRSGKFVPTKRSNPKVKGEYNPLINNYRFSSFSRNEVDYDGQEKRLFKNVHGKELPISVFETIDSIINLAIDNVKEQKLFLLGLTNSNANAMLTLLSFGVPLNDVVRFFKTPVVVEASKGKRLNGSKLVEQAKEILQDLSDDKVRNYLLATAQTDLMKELQADAVKSSGATLGTLLASKLQKLSVDTSILDEVYIGNTEHKEMSDVAVLANLSKLIFMSNETFAYSQLFTLLRAMPNKKWRMDNVASSVLKYVEFKQIDEINKEVEAHVKQQIVEGFKASDEYAALSEEEKESARQKIEGELEVDDSIYKEELLRRQRAWFLNRVGRNDLFRAMRPSAQSSFENVTILSMPHVYNSWRILNKLIRIVEQTFAVHNPRINKLADNVIKKIKHDSSFVRQEFQEAVQDNFVKFLSSDIDMELEGRQITTSVDPKETYVLPSGVNVYGETAWTQSFIKRLLPLIGNTDNELLKSIEVKYLENGLTTILLTADKVADDELVEIIRRDFLKLKAEHEDLAIDLFKYAIMTSGLYYGRTNFSNIFPASFAYAFDKAFNARLDNVLTTSNIKTDINLRIIEDAFLYQFVRNNPALLSYVPSRVRPDETGEQQLGKYTRRLLHGKDSYADGPVYFDLRFKATDQVLFDNIIRRYDSKTYIRLDAPFQKDYVYYRILSVPSSGNLFSFSESDLDAGLDLAKLKQPDLPVVTNYYRSGNVITIPETSLKIYEIRQTIYLNPNLAKLSKLEAYTVEEVREDKRDGAVQSISYKIKRKEDSDVDLSQSDLVRKLKDKPYYAEVGYNTKFATVASTQSEALAKAGKNGTVVIYGNVLDPRTGVFNIDLTQSTDEIVERLRQIPDAPNYVVDANIMRVLMARNTPTVFEDAIKIANVLYAKTGFEHPIVARSVEDVAIEAKLDRNFKIKDYTVSTNKLSNFVQQVGNVYSAPVETFTTPRKLTPGAIVYMGMTGEQHLFGHVLSIGDRVEVSLFDSAIFDFLTKKYYTVEELENIKKKINPC